MTIVLPFPPASLSGHNKGRWQSHSPLVKKLREAASEATTAANPIVPAEGDIRIHFRFVPPDRRGDRVNFPNRIKSLIDGIADALGVNDSRFLPSYEFAAPEKPGRVEIVIPGDPPFTDGATLLPAIREKAKIENDPDACANTTSGPDHERIGAAL